VPLMCEDAYLPLFLLNQSRKCLLHGSDALQSFTMELASVTDARNATNNNVGRDQINLVFSEYSTRQSWRPVQSSQLRQN
jgi:hypothetical protein